MAIGDMFLKVESARQGVVKGESNDSKHTAEIDILSWSWGMRSQSDMAGAGPSSRATLDELRVTKRADSASTALMSVMRNNELIKKGTLIVRKAGDYPLEYMKITMQNARITELTLETDGVEIVERLSISFQRINVEYIPQGPDGAARGGMMFEAEIV